MKLVHRPRRQRRQESLRRLVRETDLNPARWVYPLFIKETSGVESINSMPGIFRWGPTEVFAEVERAMHLGIKAFALFPVIASNKKDSTGSWSRRADDLIPKLVKQLKDRWPEILLMTDVALDPYSSDGHDGLVRDGKILNDETVELLVQQALVQASAGADYVAPSDMMDGRVGAIRSGLDNAGFTDVGILAYTAKYASAFYGPFREALDSAPRFGDKKTYQMDPANAREALLELELDLAEGADMVMVKPAGAYLDIIKSFKEHAKVPVAAYQVSGEYAMIKAAAERGWLCGDKAILESLTAIHRAGADIILTYAACEAALLLEKSQ
jgi:porphobilinogen synthase